MTTEQYLSVRISEIEWMEAHSDHVEIRMRSGGKVTVKCERVRATSLIDGIAKNGDFVIFSSAPEDAARSSQAHKLRRDHSPTNTQE